MAERELWYAQFGPLSYEDTDVDWYPDGKPVRGARTSQIYLDEAPVDGIEVPRRMDVDGTPGTFLEAGADGLPADGPLVDLITYLQTLLAFRCDEIRLIPKSASTGPEGTMFYDSDDDCVWVATE